MKILVVDDSLVYRTQVVKFLRESLPDAEFVTGGDGNEGLKLYQQERPDFTILDLLMPGMNGQEVLKKIKDLDQEAKVVVLTADIQKFTMEEVQALGALTFLHKPITREKAAQLVEMIRGA